MATGQCTPPRQSEMPPSPLEAVRGVIHEHGMAGQPRRARTG